MCSLVLMSPPLFTPFLSFSIPPLPLQPCYLPAPNVAGEGLSRRENRTPRHLNLGKSEAAAEGLAPRVSRSASCSGCRSDQRVARRRDGSEGARIDVISVSGLSPSPFCGSRPLTQAAGGSRPRTVVTGKDTAASATWHGESMRQSLHRHKSAPAACSARTRAAPRRAVYGTAHARAPLIRPMQAHCGRRMGHSMHGTTARRQVPAAASGSTRCLLVPGT
jgi:hypothetical protein